MKNAELLKEILTQQTILITKMDTLEKKFFDMENSIVEIKKDVCFQLSTIKSTLEHVNAQMNIIPERETRVTSFSKYKE